MVVDVEVVDARELCLFPIKTVVEIPEGPAALLSSPVHKVFERNAFAPHVGIGCKIPSSIECVVRISQVLRSVDQEMFKRCEPRSFHVSVALDIPVGIEEPGQRRSWRINGKRWWQPKRFVARSKIGDALAGTV